MSEEVEETGRRLFSASPALPLSTVIAGQCFAPGCNLSPEKEDTRELLPVQKYCVNIDEEISDDYYNMHIQQNRCMNVQHVSNVIGIAFI